ncbi:copper chaperone PCu(A)C [uncultured Rhodospira sp.]|uniref:copper chaperone PCu(A)C n=1 Tax=uncultured Rhodospira sp. TaxID=1936189 RepID=UPI00260A74FF|nr:copper chaperone PCu(A)C [uncultured Rhodospira sp.]
MIPRIRLGAAVFALGLAAAAPAMAAEVTAGSLTIADPWARASAGMARAGAAFMTITNTGDSDRLVSATANVSDVVELHTHIKDGDVMRMRKVEAIDVPAGETTMLQPGGLHVMFIGLHDPLQEGETFPVTLTFEQAGDVDVDVIVKSVGAMGGGMGHAHGSEGQ